MTENSETRKRSRGVLWRLGKILIILAVIGFVAMFATVFVSTQIYASRSAEEIERGTADVIIVLSAGVGRDSIELDPFSQARVETAVELWRRGAAFQILMSGGRYLDNVDGQIAEQMKLYAIQLGVPARVIFIEGNSISTFENARYTLKVIREDFVPLQQRRRMPVWRSAIVVTDDYHMLRASTLFDYWRQEGDIEIVAYASASGRARVGFLRSTGVLLRETLAVPFNVLKMAGQSALEAVGMGAEGEIR